MVSLEQAQSTLSQLVAKADQGDVSGGNDLLAEMKVRPHDTVVISMQYTVCSMQYAVVKYNHHHCSLTLHIHVAILQSSSKMSLVVLLLGCNI